MRSIEERLGEWYPILKPELDQDYMHVRLANFLLAVPDVDLCPSWDNVFRAFELCPPSKVKVVIIGQDPYYTRGVADGLCFSMRNGGNTPSFRNIRTAVRKAGYQVNSTDLTPWTSEGVLMLNTVLTTRVGVPNAHKNTGWLQFTSKVISLVKRMQQHKVWMLWGNQAQASFSEQLVINGYNHALMCSHPAARGEFNDFIQSDHFTKCNEILKLHSLTPVNWNT